jgi:hypothetical protein
MAASEDPTPIARLKNMVGMLWRIRDQLRLIERQAMLNSAAVERLRQQRGDQRRKSMEQSLVTDAGSRLSPNASLARQRRRHEPSRRLPLHRYPGGARGPQSRAMPPSSAGTAAVEPRRHRAALAPMQHWLGPRTCLRAAAGRRGGLGDDDSLPLQPSPNGLAQDFLIGAEILAEAPASIGPSHIIFYSNVIVPRLEPAMAPPRAPAGSHQTPKWSCSRPAPSLTSCAWSAR